MRVLIVEDDPISCAMLEKALVDMGHQVSFARNGRKALDTINGTPVQLMITDWMMPEIDGLELCRRIRSSPDEKYLYVIMLTAKDETEDLVKVLQSGADDFISKPFDPEELKARVTTGERVIALNEKLLDASLQMEMKNKKLKKALKRLEETQAQMLQSEKMASIGQLASGVAHEINNPTGFVSSNLKTLSEYQNDIARLLSRYDRFLKQLESDKIRTQLPGEIYEAVQELKLLKDEIDIEFLLEDITELVSDCREGTDRIKKIVLDLKDFAHPGEDKIQSTDINKGLDSTLNVVNNEIKYKATVDRNFGDIPTVRGYPQQLNQVFMNILVNAAQAIDKQGVIKIATFAQNGHVVVTISDNGCGIEAQHLNKIFDPFFTTKNVGRGTGLGMNIAYNIIEKHHGKIDVESEVGVGTTFTIRIPEEDLSHDDDRSASPISAESASQS
jgi:two-component system NtrC family sensor kinase